MYIEQFILTITISNTRFLVRFRSIRHRKLYIYEGSSCKTRQQDMSHTFHPSERKDSEFLGLRVKTSKVTVTRIIPFSPKYAWIKPDLGKSEQNAGRYYMIQQYTPTAPLKSIQVQSLVILQPIRGKIQTSRVHTWQCVKLFLCWRTHQVEKMHSFLLRSFVNKVLMSS